MRFILLNLGLPLVIATLSLFYSSKKVKLLTLLSLMFVSIPYMVTFTIAEGDMLKFFYFAAVLFSIISVYFLNLVIKNKIVLALFLAGLVFTSTLSSFLTLANSYLNKNLGYSRSAYIAGIWIRKNTPKKSVFVTMPTVHSATTDIAGRLRIISYINWPYSHGFNQGEDNVFTRAADVEDVYETGDIEKIKLKYSADYVYLGQEERSNYPDAGSFFDKNPSLRKVYSKDDIDIYKVLN